MKDNDKKICNKKIFQLKNEIDEKKKQGRDVNINIPNNIAFLQSANL